MIQIHVNPTRVEKVVFVFDSEMESDFDLAAWLVIQPLVKRVNRTLKAAVRRSLTSPEENLIGRQRRGSSGEDRR